MSTLEIPFHENTATGARRVPLFIARNQLYYWTCAWQEGEAEALRDLEEGRYRTFPNGRAAAAWLLRDDED